MATSVLEQILLNVQSGALLPLDAEPEDPTTAIESTVHALVEEAEAGIRRVAEALAKSAQRPAGTPDRFRRALEEFTVRESEATTAASNEPEQLEEIQTLLGELAPDEPVTAPPRVPLADIQSMIELLK